MPINQPVNREEIRMLVLNLGYERTAQQTGIKPATLRQWAKRFAWKPKHSQETVTSVTRPSDILADELAESEKQTRISLARSAKQMAKDCEGLPVRHADKAYTVAKTAAIVHRWDQKDQATGNVVVNIALLGIQPSEVQAQAIDIDPGVSE